jgi:hypothetical protein
MDSLQALRELAREHVSEGQLLVCPLAIACSHAPLSLHQSDLCMHCSMAFLCTSVSLLHPTTTSDPLPSPITTTRHLASLHHLTLQRSFPSPPSSSPRDRLRWFFSFLTPFSSLLFSSSLLSSKLMPGPSWPLRLSTRVVSFASPASASPLRCSSPFLFFPSSLHRITELLPNRALPPFHCPPRASLPFPVPLHLPTPSPLRSLTPGPAAAGFGAAADGRGINDGQVRCMLHLPPLR